MENILKVVQTLNYFALAEGGSINKRKALKLIWLSDRLHLRLNYRTITYDIYHVDKEGPAASIPKALLNGSLHNVHFDEYLKNEGDCYSSVKKLSDKSFSISDLRVLDVVWNKFKDLGADDLIMFSKEYPEVKNCEEMLKESSYIAIEGYDFFKDPKCNDELFNQSQELLDLTEEMYTEQNIIYRMFR